MERPIAFVSGASRGIGKATAIALAEAGYDLVICARTVRSGEVRDNSLTVHRTDLRPLPGSLEETAHAIEEAGGRALTIPLDLTERASVGAGAERTLCTWGRVDLLVHNGRYLGPGQMDVFMDTPVDAYEKFVDAHCIAPVILTRAFLPGMLARGHGQIVTITSSAASEAPPAPAGRGGWGLAYSVGKAAGHQLVGTLHAEFRDKGILAYNVQPGFVVTERSGMVLTDHGIDVSRGAPPEIIAAVIAWLATSAEGARYAGTTIQAQQLCRDLHLHPQCSALS